MAGRPEGRKADPWEGYQSPQRPLCPQKKGGR